MPSCEGKGACWLLWELGRWTSGVQAPHQAGASLPDLGPSLMGSWTVPPPPQLPVSSASASASNKSHCLQATEGGISLKTGLIRKSLSAGFQMSSEDANSPHLARSALAVQLDFEKKAHQRGDPCTSALH